MKKKVIIILGMHRSGTSALTGLLHKLGIPIGEDLLPAIPGDNDKGYWEHSDFVKINDAILEKLDSAWDKLLHPNEILLESFNDEANEISLKLDNHLSDSEIFIVKDPRISRILPIWLTAFKKSNITPLFCIISRNPLEVADSLYKRDEMFNSNAYLLWLQHYLFAEYQTRDFLRTFISYDNLLADADTSIKNITKALNIESEINRNKLNKVSKSFIDKSLKHHNYKHSEIENKVISGWVTECIELLNTVNELDDNSVKRRFDSLRSSFNETTEVFILQLKQQYMQINNIGSGFENAIQIIENQKDTLSNFMNTFNQVDDGYQQAVSMLQERDSQLIKKKSDFSNLSRSFEDIGIHFLKARKNLIQKENELKTIMDNYNSVLDENFNKEDEINELITSYKKLNDNYNEKEIQLNNIQQDLNKLRTSYDEASTSYENSTRLLESKESELGNLKVELNNLYKVFREVEDGFKQAIEIINQQNIIKEANMPIKELKINKSDDHEFNSEEYKLYEAKVDLRVDNNSHTKVYRMIEEHNNHKSAKILEVGCSTGFFGEVLKDYGHEVWGLELSEESSKIAANRLDKVLHGTIEDFLTSEKYKQERFDYIIFGDVLEHLVDPLDVLIKCKNFLNGSGAIVSSIPNVSHIAVRAMLVEGKWDYSDYGILDNTHLKFFTKNSIIELFTDAKYEIKRLDPIILQPELTGITYNNDILDSISTHIDDDQQHVFQYVSIAEKSEKHNLKNINDQLTIENSDKLLCLLPIADWSIGDIRIVNPLQAYSNYFGGRVRIKQIGTQTSEDLHWADCIVLQRESNEYVLGLMSVIQQMDKKIIFDIDDLLTDVPEFLSIHAHSKNVKPFLEEALRMSDMVTVTTERLKSKIKIYTNNVHVIPNCALTVHEPIKHTKKNKVNILLGSTDTVRIEFILDVFSKLANIDGYDLKFIAIGPPAEKLKEINLDVEAHPIMTHDQFKSFISSLDNTIGIIPLDHSVFSSCKSVIKYLDYSLAGIPSICSNVAPYSDVLKNNETGILSDNDEQTWFTEICKLIESPEKRKVLSNNARNFTMSNYSMHQSAKKWNSLLDTIQSNQGQIGSEMIENLKSNDIEELNRSNHFYKKLFRLHSYQKTYQSFKVHGFKSIKSVFK